MTRKIEKSAAEWRSQLTEQQYHVTRERGTERAFTGAYWDHWEPGRYHCICCGAPLFSAVDKFDAGCGWPSFSRAAAAENIETAIDRSHFMVRTEVLCQQCGAHLGHVFDDGPPPSGLRYCINSAALAHQPETDADS